MKINYSICLLSVLVFACKKDNNEEIKSNNSSTSGDTIQIEKSVPPPKQTTTSFSNERFHNVIIEKVDKHKFRIHGKAQVWEANLNWVVEDGHNELKSGFATTDTGAPEWGNFDFIIDIEKKDDFSTLILVLFEESAEDGSRKYELPIPLK